MTESLVLRGIVVGGSSGSIDDGIVVVDGELISWVGAAKDYALADGQDPADVPDATDCVILPGLIDVHSHGAAGAGFPNTDAAGARVAASHHREHGTTGLLASLVSAPRADLMRQAAMLADLVEDGEILGIHLEGPFINCVRCGAQDPAAIVSGDPDLLEEVCNAARGHVRSMTLAPETENFGKLLDVMRRREILPSFGHTDADAATTSTRIGQAARSGRVSATHLFNGMPPLHHRSPGPVAACLAAAGRGEMVVELIADGVHLAPETVSMVFDTVGADQIALVSDSMAAAGMADGNYQLGALNVVVSGGVARLATSDGSDGAIAGGTARLLDVLRSTVFDSGVALADAVTAATRTPATLLGLHDSHGSLTAGYRADILVTDRHLRPVRVLHGGRAAGKEI